MTKYKPAKGFLIVEEPVKIREDVNGLVIEEVTRSFETARVLESNAVAQTVGVGATIVIPADAGQQLDSKYWIVDEEDIRAIVA